MKNTTNRPKRTARKITTRRKRPALTPFAAALDALIANASSDDLRLLAAVSDRCDAVIRVLDDARDACAKVTA